MKGNTYPGNSKRIVKLMLSGALWVLFAALITGALVLVFSWIWKDNTLKHTEEECKLLADAVLEKFVVDENRSKKDEEFMKLYYYDLNALSGFAHVFGGTNKEELDEIQDWSEFVPEAIAVWKKEEYTVLTGSFPRDEFDKALEAGEKQRYADYYEVPIEEAKSPVFDGPMALVGTSQITQVGEKIYILSEFRGAEAVVISKFAYDERLSAIATGVSDDDIPTLEEGYVADSKVDLVMIQKSDNSVVQATEGINVKIGDILADELDGDGRLQINGEWYAGGTAETDKYKVFALISEANLLSRNVVSPVFLAIIFACTFLLMGLYAAFFLDDIRKKRVPGDSLSGNEVPMLEMLTKNVRLMFYIVSVVTSVLVLLICLLCVVDSNRLWGDDILEDVERYYQLDSESTEILDLFRKGYKQNSLSKMRYLLEASEVRMTEEAIYDLSEAMKRQIFLLDKNGVVQAASEDEYDFTGITDPDSNLYALSGMLAGKADNVSFMLTDSENRQVPCWAVRLKKTGGILLNIDDDSQTLSFSDYYANYQAPEGMTIFSVDVGTGTILSSSDPAYSGKNAGSIGIDESTLKDGFAGDIMINGRRAFVHAQMHGNRANLVAGDLGYMFVEYLPIILMTLLAGLLTVALFLVIVFKLQKKTWSNPLTGTYHPVDVVHADDSAAVGRWLNPLIPFKNQTAGSKLHTVLHLSIAIALIVGYVLYQNVETTKYLGSALPYLLQRSWREGLNIYALTYALLMNCVVIVVGLALRMLVLFSGSKFGSRGETIARLFGSFITYVAIAGAFAYGLVFLGVNTTAIFASAGIVGLAISIGAKDLISDVFAGIFIVFEGEFRTGDIVDISGYRGTVEEIGVRTTKVMSMENVKVFRNTQVSGAINMTQRYSIAEVRIDVSRGEPLEEIRKIFIDALPGIREKITYEISEIKLAGIDQMTASGLVFLFQTNCKESDRVFIERQLRWQFDLLMEKEQIASSGAIGSGSVRLQEK